MESLIIAKLIVLLQMWIALLGTSTPAVDLPVVDVVATSTPSEVISLPIPQGDLPVFDMPVGGPTNAPAQLFDGTSPNLIDSCHIRVTIGANTFTKKVCTD